MARDYRSDAYRNAILAELDPATGLPGRQTQASYTMAAPDWSGGGDTYGGTSFDELTGGYERRNEGEGGALRGAAGGAAAGATVGSAIPVLGTLAGGAIGGLIGGIGGAFTKSAPTARTDFALADAQRAIGNAYRSKMGREAGADEITGQLGNIGWQQGDRYVGEMGLRAIIDSLKPENDAAAARARATGAPAASGAPATAPGAPPSGGQFTGGSGALVDPYALPKEDDIASLLASAQRYGDYDASTGRIGAAGAGGGNYAYGGFDFAQDAGNRDLGKSAKYAFSHLAGQAAAAGAPQPTTKEGAEAWFNQYIAPGLQQLGYEIAWVQGDKARIKTREGWDEIDFLGNAGGDNPTLTWQSGLLAPGSSGGMSTGSTGGGSGAGYAGLDVTSSALFKQLMQQVQDMAAGKSTGPLATDSNALINLLAREA
jgi:hypothetical protein